MNLNHKKTILLVSVIILLNVIPQFLSLNLINRLTKNLKKKYNFFFRIENLRLKGIKKFTFNSVYIKTGRYKIILKNGLIIINLHAFIHKKSFHEIVRFYDLREVFVLLLKPKKKIPRNPGNHDKFYLEKIYYSFFRKIIEKFSCLSFTGNIKRILIITSFRNKVINLFIKDLKMHGNAIKGYVEIRISDYWVKTPFILEKNRDAGKIEISSPNNLQQNLVTISDETHNLFSFSEYKIAYKERDNSNYIISGQVSDILISSQKVSQTPILIKKLEAEQLIKFTENEFRILKESSLNFDGISSFLEFHHCCDESDLLKMSVIFFLDGADFLEKFPFLSVPNIRSLEVRGETAVKLDYMTSLTDFSSYYFKSQVLQNTLNIKKSKEFDISYLERDFVHGLNRSEIVRAINVSKDNKDFLSINEIPSYLKNVIVTTEDPNFYKHKGIDGYFVGVAIAKNIVNKKYVKGASTITMQLAKNLFLTKTKSPVRKFEEVVLAWLMENSFNLSKNRILEIYLNIIEFGENIYGVAEAAQYYFEKKVSELDITESLVLSYIIPRPKFFLEAVLMKSPKLIEKLTDHIDFYSNYLLIMKLIDKERYSQIKYCIRFSPPIGTLELKIK